MREFREGGDRVLVLSREVLDLGRFTVGAVWGFERWYLVRRIDSEAGKVIEER